MVKLTEKHIAWPLGRKTRRDGMLDVPGTDPWSGRLVRGRGHIIAALGLGAQWLSLLPRNLLVLGRPQKPVQATAAAILGLRLLDLAAAGNFR